MCKWSDPFSKRVLGHDLAALIPHADRDGGQHKLNKKRRGL